MTQTNYEEFQRPHEVTPIYKEAKRHEKSDIFRKFADIM